MAEIEDSVGVGVTVDQFDLRAQQHSFDMQRLAEETKRDVEIERQKTKRRRTEFYTSVVIGLLVAVVLLAIVAGSVYLLDQPAGPDHEQQREHECIAEGGGWVPKDLLASGNSHGLCVFPGKQSSG